MSRDKIFAFRSIPIIALVLVLVLALPVFPQTKAQAAKITELKIKPVFFKSSGGEKTVKIKKLNPRNIKEIVVIENPDNDKHAYVSIEPNVKKGALIISAKENKSIDEDVNLSFFVNIRLKKKKYKDIKYPSKQLTIPLSISVKKRGASGKIKNIIITGVDKGSSSICALDAENPDRVNINYDPLARYFFDDKAEAFKDPDHILGRTVSIKYASAKANGLVMSDNTRVVYGAFKADSDTPGFGEYLEDMITEKKYYVKNGSKKAWPTLAVNRGQEPVPLMKGGEKMGRGTVAFDIADNIGTKGVVYAKLELDGSGKINTITYIPSWDGVVIADKVEGTSVYSGTTATFLKDYAVLKDGRTVGMSGIKEGDIVFFNAKGRFAEIYSENKTEGVITAVDDGSFSIGSKNYPFELLRYVKASAGLVSADRAYLERLMNSKTKVTVFKDRMDRPVIIEEAAVKTETKTLLLSSPAIPANSLNGTFKLTGFEGVGSAPVSYEVDPSDLSSVSEKITDPASLFLAGELVTLTVAENGTVVGLEFEDAVAYSGKTAFSNALTELGGKPVADTVSVYRVKVPSDATDWSAISAGGACAPTGIAEITAWDKFTGMMSEKDAAEHGLVRIYQNDAACTSVVVFDNSASLGYLSPDPIQVEGISGSTEAEFDVVPVFVTGVVTEGTRIRSLSLLDANGRYTEPFTDIAEGVRIEGAGHFYDLKISKDGRKILGTADVTVYEQGFSGVFMQGTSESDFCVYNYDREAHFALAANPFIVEKTGDATYRTIAQASIATCYNSDSQGRYVTSGGSDKITKVLLDHTTAATTSINTTLQDLASSALGELEESVDSWKTAVGYAQEKTKLAGIDKLEEIYKKFNNITTDNFPAKTNFTGHTRYTTAAGFKTTVDQDISTAKAAFYDSGTESYRVTGYNLYKDGIKRGIKEKPVSNNYVLGAHVGYNYCVWLDEARKVADQPQREVTLDFIDGSSLKVTFFYNQLPYYEEDCSPDTLRRDEIYS